MNRYPMPLAAPGADPFMLLAGEMRALRQDIARYMQRPSGGDNPFGYPPRPASIYEHGVGHSGPRQVIDDTGSKQLLNVALKEIVPQGYYGMATIHVSVKTEREIPEGERAGVPNAVLLGHLKWQNGDAGGDQDVDLTRGAIIPVGATTSIQLEAEFFSAVAGEALVLFRTVSVEAGVSWETSSDKDAPMTLPAIPLAEATPSAWLEIPLQARSMLGLGFPSTAYPGLLAQFSISNGAGARTLYEVPDPFRNGAPIRNGVNFVRFVSPAVMTFIQPTFDLW